MTSNQCPFSFTKLRVAALMASPTLHMETASRNRWCLLPSLLLPEIHNSNGPQVYLNLISNLCGG